MSLHPSICTVVVRAWVEPDGAAADLRARVLVIRDAQAETDEVGAAAGLDEVLMLVSDALVSIVDTSAGSSVDEHRTQGRHQHRFG